MADSSSSRKALSRRNETLNADHPLTVVPNANEFVAHSSGSNTPRKRVSQACDRCRSRKDKCDGARPVCSTCAALGTVCSYEPSTKKRGLPEGYVRGLEKLWGVTIREVKGLEDTVIELFNRRTIAVAWKDGIGSDGGSLVEAWRKSRLLKVLEEVSPVLDLVEEKDKSTKRKRADFTSNEEPTDLTTTATDATPTTDINEPGSSIGHIEHHIPTAPAARIAETHNDFQGSFLARATRLLLTTHEASTLPLPPDTWQLLDIYFSHVHCWFPIVEKRDLLKTSYAYSSDSSEVQCLEDGQKGNYAALWAALTYSEHLRSVLAKHTSEKDEPDCTTDASYSYLIGLIPREDGEFEMGHVQALLLMALVQMGNDRWSQAWLLIGKAVRVAIDLDLCSSENTGIVAQTKPMKQNLAQSYSGSSSRRKHVWFGCFALDTIIASRINRRPHLRSDDIEQLIEEDGLEEWDPWTDALGIRKIHKATRSPGRVLSTYNQFIRIVSVLNDLISTKKLSPEHLRRVHADFMQIDHGLPVPFAPLWDTKPRQVADSQTILPHSYHLHLTYIATAAALQLRDLECVLHERHSTEIFASTIRQVAKLLKHESQHLGLLIIPPTFGCFLAITGECVFLDQDNIIDDYRHDILHSLLTMAKGWRAFESLQDMFRILESTTRQSAAVQPLHDPYTMSVQGHVASDSPLDHILHHRSHHLVPAKSQMADSHFITRSTSGPNILGLQSFEQSHAQMPAQTDSILFRGSATNMVPPHESSSSTDGRFIQPDPWPRDNSLSGGSPGFEIDGDSMFNEFAALDALEWTNNWDQSLVNLGFTDHANMSQDFHNFCREPDPLSSDNLVYQLIADTSTHSNQQHVQSYNSSAMEFSNQQVEASQILQALASARFSGAENNETR